MDDNKATATTVLDLSAGGSHSVAILGSHEVATWGQGEEGQLGHGDADDLTVPKVVDVLRNVRVGAVVCGAQHTVAIGDKEVYSWGWGDFGRLGHGRGDDMVLPQPVSFFSGMRIRQVACGDSHTLALNEAGELYSFGRGQNGQLGLGDTKDSLSPQLVRAFWGQDVKSVAAGSEFSMALLMDGQTFAFGWGQYGNLGDGHCQDRHKPTLVCGLTGLDVVAVQCGWRHSVVKTHDGRIYSFGWNKFGQLGQGSYSESCNTPEQVTLLADKTIKDVACGWRHTLAIDKEGIVYAWGWNKFGQLGLNDLEDRCAPERVGSLVTEGHRIAKLACGWRHSLALTEAGVVFSWGRGVNGQLGLGTQEDVSIPTLVNIRHTSGDEPTDDFNPSDAGCLVPECNDGEEVVPAVCVPQSSGADEDAPPTVSISPTTSLAKRPRTDDA